MTRVTVQLSALVERGKKQGKLAIAAAHPCAEKDCQGHLRRLKGKNGFFWSCVTCRKTSEDNGGSPTTNQLPRRAKKGKRRSSTRKKSARSQQVAT